MKNSFFRKIMVLVLTVCMMFPMAEAVLAAQSGDVHLDLQIECNNNTVTAKILIAENTINFTDLEYKLFFDQSELEFVRQIDGNTDLIVEGYNNPKGYWKCLAHNESGYKETGNLVTVEFKVKADAPKQVTLYLDDAKVLDKGDDGSIENRKLVTVSGPQTITVDEKERKSYFDWFKNFFHYSR